MLGRFICPASRLEELAGRLMLSMERDESPWPVSAILDGDPALAAVTAWSFDAEMNPGAQIALVEVPLPAAAGDGRQLPFATSLIDDTVTAAFTASHTATPFFEVPVGDGWESGIATVADALVHYRGIKNRRVGAKLRCGGLVAEAFPSSRQVATFIAECVARHLPFKATAGLHHPIRHHDRSLDVMRHGFVNLLAAAAFAHQGWSVDRLIEVVEEQDPAAFSVAAAGLVWRDESVRTGSLARTREQFAGYGSCSFTEPTADLLALGMIKLEETA